MDQDKNALDMIVRFTRNKPLASNSPSDRPQGGVAAATQGRQQEGAEAVPHTPMKRQPGEQKVLAGATWQVRRAGPDSRDADMEQ